MANQKNPHLQLVDGEPTPLKEPEVEVVARAKSIQEKYDNHPFSTGGFSAINSFMLSKLGVLGLNPVDQLVILHIFNDRYRAPSITQMAKAIGVSRPLICKSIARLEKAGFLIRTERRVSPTLSRSNHYNLGPLWFRVQDLYLKEHGE